MASNSQIFKSAQEWMNRYGHSVIYNYGEIIIVVDINFGNKLKACEECSSRVSHSSHDRFSTMCPCEYHMPNVLLCTCTDCYTSYVTIKDFYSLDNHV